MRQKILFSAILLVFLLSSSSAHTGWFGPSNYDECILDSMKGVTNDKAAILIMRSCRAKFPESKTPKVKSRDLPYAALSQITGRAGLSYGNRFSGNLYNGNPSLTITQVTIEISTKYSYSGIDTSKQYNIDVNIPPLTSKDFGVDIVTGGEAAKYDWSIVYATGY